MAKIEKLTDAQVARFPEFIKRWTDIGLCTDPADRPKAEACIRDIAAYRRFLADVGYLVPVPAGVRATTANVDQEIAQQAGPQLVVPRALLRAATHPLRPGTATRLRLTVQVARSGVAGGEGRAAR